MNKSTRTPPPLSKGHDRGYDRNVDTRIVTTCGDRVHVGMYLNGLKEDRSDSQFARNTNFFGITGYYRKFVKGYADIAAPLFSLLKKENVWNWNLDCQEAYPILRIPDLSRKFQIYTDASGLAL
jgi:hypothetical protein